MKQSIVITNIVKQIGNRKDDLKKEYNYPSLTGKFYDNLRSS